MGCASSKPSTADSETAKPPAAPQRANPAARPAVSSLEEQTQPVPKPGPAAVLPPSRPGENGVQSAHSSGSQPQQTPTKQQQQTLQPSLIQPEIQAAQNGPTTPSTASAQHEQVCACLACISWSHSSSKLWTCIHSTFCSQLCCDAACGDFLRCRFRFMMSNASP